MKALGGYSPPMANTPPIRASRAFIQTVTLLIGLVTSSLVGFQTAPDAPQIPSGKELERIATSVPILGFSIHLPNGSEVQRQQSSAGLTYQFLPSVVPAPTAQNPQAVIRPWSLRAQVVQGGADQTSPTELIGELVAAQRQSGAVLSPLATTHLEIEGNEPFTLDYFEQQLPDGVRVIWGYTAISVRENHFLLFTLLLSPETYQPYRPVLEESLKTIRRTSKAETSLSLRACMSRGQTFLDSLTPDRLKKLIGLRQWVRIYRPASAANGTDQEVGYALLNVEMGNKEAVQSGDKQDHQEDGLLITVQARVVVDAERSVYRDSIGLYWMAWNQEEEIWSVRGTQRQGEAELSEAESGLRLPESTGNPRPELIVIRAGRESNTRTPSQWKVPNVYLSQPLGWLLGRLLPTTADAVGEYCFYFYDYTSESPTLSRRLDHWAPATDGSGGWILTTRLNPTAPPTTARYLDGVLIDQQTADGVRTVPITSAELDKIWNTKRLRR